MRRTGRGGEGGGGAPAQPPLAIQKRLPLRDARAVGGPISVQLLGALFGVALVGWAAATVALVVAAPDLAGGRPGEVAPVLATHLLTLGVLPFAVAGASFHLLPVLLRNELRSERRLWVALPLLGGGFLLAPGVALGLGWLTWPGAGLLTGGLVLVLVELGGLVRRAPAGRMLVASRTGVALSLFHVIAALVLGATLFSRGDLPIGGTSHDRWLLVHLSLAVLGWLTLLIVTVGRTLAPMLALAPSAGPRRLPADELSLAAALWILLAGLAAGSREVSAGGVALVAAALTPFARLVIRSARSRRIEPEAPLLHLLAGLVFLLESAALGISTLFGALGTQRGTSAAVLLLLVGWAAGVVLGHLGKLLSLSIWVWWPPGPRPKQFALYPRGVWQAEALVFAVGVETAAAGVAAGSGTAARAGAGLLLLSAVLAVAGSAATWRRRATSRGPAAGPAGAPSSSA